MFSVIKCFTENHGTINCVNRERLLLVMRVNVSCSLKGKLTAGVCQPFHTSLWSSTVLRFFPVPFK